jgi:kynurenine formamidase
MGRERDIQKGERELKIFDLSIPYEAGMPYFKGDPVPEVKQFKTIERDGYNVKELKIGTHTGTHIDAPSHFIEGGKSVDQLEISDLWGIGTCIPYDPHRKMELPLQQYEIIFLYTGYNLKWHEFKIFENYSYIKKEDAEKLREYGVKLVGIDSPTAESQDSGNFDSHKILLAGSIPIVENLNSESLKSVVNHSFLVQVTPLLIRDGDGSPARVVAIEV